MHGVMKAILCVLIIILTTVSAERKLLQIFKGTVTEISCSTTAPSFFLNGIYSSQHYDLLPGLFGIEAVVAPDRSNVTLRINGTSLTDNVTIECQNIIDPVIGLTETLFWFTMVFIDTLPSPTSVHLDGSTLLWRPPPPFHSLLSLNVSTITIDPRITHYMVYMVDLHTNSEMVVRSQQPKFAFPCVYSVQVSAVNSAGEGERSSSTTINNCVEAFATDGLQTATKESDSNQTFNVYDQEVTLRGKEYENRTEKLHSGTLGIMIGTIAVTGSIAMVSLAFNCILLTLLTRKVKNFKKSTVIDDPGEKNEEEVIMEENGAYACAANLSPTYATICAHY